VFSTGADLLRFAEMVRCEGAVAGDGHQVLRPSTVARMLEHQVDARVATPFGQGWGFRLGDEAVLGTASRRTVGHSGFTGTSLVVDLDAGRSTVLLTNAVHPVRGRIDLQPVRQMVMDEVRARFR
jgi:CubicO group peptidase (beta-lactamase class C family)